ncbi:MAG: HNH endonuclease [Polyangiaceae bacterium]|nr:HNH endonuclease [Polyangiaceae bacterium]
MVIRVIAAGNYTWHHHQDGKTMQLIERNVHRDFFHTGGMATTR